MNFRAKLLVAAAALAMQAGCAQVGTGGEAGCKTVYVFVPGGANGTGAVQPVSRCSDLPRESLDGATALAMGPETLSPQAAATRASNTDQTYASANDMIANADMAAFMERIRSDYVEKSNTGAWGFLIVDALAAGQTVLAQDAVDLMGEGAASSRYMNAKQLKPWVLAFAGRNDTAEREMAGLSGSLNPPTLVGHMALLKEGMGDTEGALAKYQVVTETFYPPSPEVAGTPAYLSQAIAFNGQRLLALRQVELLRALNRDPEAKIVLERLLTAAPDDRYVSEQIETLGDKTGRPTVRTLKQAMAQALADEASSIEEQQAVMSMMTAQRTRPPFNYLTSSIRQAALLLDPHNASVRITESQALYNDGHFAAALRLAQLADARDPDGRAALASVAALAAIELGGQDATRELIERTLKTRKDANAKLGAASVFVSAGLPDRALQLTDDVLRGKPGDDERVAALITQAQARFQKGDIEGSVASARAAFATSETRGTKEFMASMLVASKARPEGLAVMREMLAEAPNDTGMMNNFGYALINNPASDAELDEGFQWLKDATRLTPDEPNLLDSVGWAYYQFGDFEEANKYLGLAVEAYLPFNNWEIHDHLGDVRWRLGQADAARESWKAALAAYPPNHERAEIEEKLSNGLTTPPPARRETPDVPLMRMEQRETSDI